MSATSAPSSFPTRSPSWSYVYTTFAASDSAPVAAPVVEKSPYANATVSFSCMSLERKHAQYISLWYPFQSGPRPASFCDRQALIALEIPPLPYKICTPATFQHFRIVGRLVRTRTCPKTATYSPSRYYKNLQLYRHHNLKASMAVLSQAFHSRF